MALVTTTEMFKKAYHGGYAVGAFNVNNMEIVQGITEAAKEENAPLILQVSAGARKYANHTQRNAKTDKTYRVINISSYVPEESTEHHKPTNGAKHSSN